MTDVDDHPDGWDGARKGECGISCVCLYDTSTERFHVYAAEAPGDDISAWHADDMTQCMDHLNSADILVGFNTVAFDTPALQGFSGVDVLPPQYDVLNEIWKGLGKREKGYGLNPVCDRLGLGKKNLFRGESPVKLYQAARVGRLVDYCIGDVSLTRKLANHINKYGSITSPSGELVNVKTLGVDV